MPGLLVFDKDGVLLDFHHRWAVVTRERAAALAEAAGDPSAASELAGLLGLDEDDRVAPGGLLAAGSRLESTTVAAGWLHQRGLPWAAARAAARDAFALADERVDFARTSRPLPGVVEAVKALHAAGWGLAIATTDQTQDARRFLDLTGLAPYFTSVVGVDRVAAGKPNPDMFLLACAESGVEPGSAWMVGDLDVDLQMGRAAGAVGTIGVLAGVGDADLLAPHADFVLADVPALLMALQAGRLAPETLAGGAALEPAR